MKSIEKSYFIRLFFKKTCGRRNNESYMIDRHWKSTINNILYLMKKSIKATI